MERRRPRLTASLHIIECDRALRDPALGRILRYGLVRLRVGLIHVGKVVFRRAVGKKNVRELPRKVKSKLREYSLNHDVAHILAEIREKHLPKQQ